MGAQKPEDQNYTVNTLPWPDNYPDRQRCIEHFRAHVQMEREEYQLKQHVPDAWLRQLSSTQMFVLHVCS